MALFDDTNAKSPERLMRRDSLFDQQQLRDEDELSIDLHDGGAIFGQDRSFMSDFPEDFLQQPRGHVAAPASGADGGHATFFAGQKRRRVMASHMQQIQDPFSVQQPYSTQMTTPVQGKLLDNCSLSQSGDEFAPCGNNYQATDSSLDSIAAMRKQKNRDAAKRSRQKKKADQNNQLHQSDRVVKENNKLKLDNAALRAENILLKRQLSYFENLFAKKTHSQPLVHHQGHQGGGGYEHVSTGTHTRSSGSGSVISASEITQKRRPDPSHDLVSAGTEEEGEISFVLERNVGDSPTGNKLGLFSLALIMCVCCFSSFFGTQIGTNLQDGASQAQMSSGIAAGHGGSMSLKVAATEKPNPANEQVAQMVESDKDQAHVTVQQAQMSFLHVLLNAIWINLLKVVFLVAFAFCLLLFPKDELVQWAARKPFFRKIFDFTDVPIAAQTKFIKSDKLV